MNFLKKRLILLLAVTALLSTNALGYSGGTGDPATPYEIATLADLQELSTTSTDWGKDFILTANINAAATNDGAAGFTPITTFSGTLNGKGYSIDSLYINLTTNTVGFIGTLNGTATIDSLKLTNVNITGGAIVGGLVGKAQQNSNINCCGVTGSVTGTATGGEIGGLVGSSSGLINKSYSNAIITGAQAVGGLIGKCSDGFNEVNNCYATGLVSKTTGNQRYGGLIGFFRFRSTATNSYSIGNLNIGASVGGGFIGAQANDAPYTGCYWDKEACTGVTVGVGTGVDVKGLTTAEFATDTFSNAGWDFNNIWCLGKDTDDKIRPILQWSAYSITYNLNGGTNADTNAVFYTGNGDVSIADASKSGEVFLGWYEESDFSGNVVTLVDAGRNENIILYAKFGIAPQQYDVTFTANTGTGNDYTQTFDDGETKALIANTFTKTNFSFAGWNTAADGSGDSYTDEANFTMDVQGQTLYAQWTANEYNVTFNANGGTGSDATQAFSFGETKALTANTFTQTGYSFSAWNTAADGTGDSYADEANFTMDVQGQTLYAQWTANEYNVTFNANGGTGSDATQAFSFGETKALMTNTFTYTDYNFTGWNTAADGSGDSYADEADFTMDVQGQTLYAQWASEIYDVTFNANGGTGSDYTQTFGKDETKALSTNTFTYTGYNFTGWNTAADGSGDSYDDEADFTMDVEGATLYAQWEIVNSAYDNGAYSLSVHPNPVVNTLTIELNTDVEEVSIISSTGITVYSTVVDNNTIKVDMSSFTSGVYFVKVKNEIIKLIKE